MSCILRQFNKRWTITMMMLTRTILISALLLSSAYAQPATAPQPAPAFVPVPVLVGVPANGCVWAGRPFSDGAGFCVADKVMQSCTQGKWAREANSDGGHGALADTRRGATDGSLADAGHAGGQQDRRDGLPQSIFQSGGFILRDASRSLSSGAHSRDPLAMLLRMRSSKPSW